MKQNQPAKPSTQTGPLTPATVGQFTFRDGVWYLCPAPHTFKQPTVK